MDDSLPVAMCNGDLVFIDIDCAEECRMWTYMEPTCIRIISLHRCLSKVGKKIGHFMFTEFREVGLSMP
jgi:hypothetical protein